MRKLTRLPGKSHPSPASPLVEINIDDVEWPEDGVFKLTGKKLPLVIKFIGILFEDYKISIYDCEMSETEFIFEECEFNSFPLVKGDGGRPPSKLSKISLTRCKGNSINLDEVGLDPSQVEIRVKDNTWLESFTAGEFEVKYFEVKGSSISSLSINKKAKELILSEGAIFDDIDITGAMIDTIILEGVTLRSLQTAGLSSKQIIKLNELLINNKEISLELKSAKLIKMQRCKFEKLSVENVSVIESFEINNCTLNLISMSGKDSGSSQKELFFKKTYVGELNLNTSCNIGLIFEGGSNIRKKVLLKGLSELDFKCENSAFYDGSKIIIEGCEEVKVTFQKCQSHNSFMLIENCQSVRKFKLDDAFINDLRVSDSVFECRVNISGAPRADGQSKSKSLIFSDSIFKSAFSIKNWNVSDMSFEGSTVEDVVYFENIRLEKVPDFRRTQIVKHFSTDGIDIPSEYKPDADSDHKKNVSRIARMRQLAADAHDHELALKLWSNELDAMSYYKGMGFGTTVYLFKKLSNYGRSIFSPVIGIVVVWLVSASLNFVFARNYIAVCKDVDYAALVFNSMTLSFTQLFPFVTSARDLRLGLMQTLFPCGSTFPVSIGVVGSVTSAISFLFFFLIGLALRNRFKIG